MYKNMTVAELETTATQKGINVQELQTKYTNPGIYRMRLTMALKKADGVTTSKAPAKRCPSRTRILEVLGVSTDRSERADVAWVNGINPIEIVPARDEWNLDPEGLTQRGFKQVGQTLTIEARKGTYRESELGDVGYWCRQYVIYYNSSQDHVAVVYKYYHQWASGVTGGTHSKRIHIFDANTFR